MFAKDLRKLRAIRQFSGCHGAVLVGLPRRFSFVFANWSSLAVGTRHRATLRLESVARPKNPIVNECHGDITPDGHLILAHEFA